MALSFLPLGLRGLSPFPGKGHKVYAYNIFKHKSCLELFLLFSAQTGSSPH